MALKRNIIDLSQDEDIVLNPKKRGVVDLTNLEKEYSTSGSSSTCKESQYTSNEPSQTYSSSMKHNHSRISFVNSKWQPFYMLTSEHMETNISQTDTFKCISMQDILNIDSSTAAISQIVLINFMIDVEWLVGEYPVLLQYPVLCIHGSEVDTAPSNFTVCSVDMGMERYGTHHSKMAFVFTSTGLRIAIFTANFIEVDLKYMTNAVYVQDFPLKETGVVSVCEFQEVMTSYMRNVRLRNRQDQLDKVITKLADFDYSSAYVDIIASVPGRHSGRFLSAWGHSRLEECLKRSLSSTPQQTQRRLVLQASSFGTMGKNDKFFNELITSMSSHALQTSTNQIDVYWPSAKDVRNSILVIKIFNIHTLFDGIFRATLQDHRFEAHNRHLKPWKGTPSGREHIMPHMKCYFSIQDSINPEKLDWFLLTSANISQAAWGCFEKNNQQLYVKSYEMGVLYLPNKIEKNRRDFSLCPFHFALGLDDIDDDHSISNDSQNTVFTISSIKDSSNMVIHFPIPFLIHSKKYETGDMPWVGDLRYNIADKYGRFSCNE